LMDAQSAACGCCLNRSCKGWFAVSRLMESGGVVRQALLTASRLLAPFDPANRWHLNRQLAGETGIPVPAGSGAWMSALVMGS